MPTRELIVYLDGQRIGVLSQSGAGGRIGFRYDDAYRLGANSTPLSLSMPLAAAEARPAAARAFITGLLPDSEAALTRLGRKHGVSPRNPFALLACVGRDAAGAVQILPEDVEPPDAAQRQGDVQWLTAAQFDETIAELGQNPDSWGTQRDTGRWSLAGAQSKVALYRGDDGRWGVPLDATPTTHILKPSMPTYDGHHLNEHLCLAAARQVGLPAARSELLSDPRFEVLISERYDRRTIDRRVVRLHQEDLCQALSVEPSQKYQSDGGPGVRQIADLLRAQSTGDNVDESLRRFFDYLVFNVLIGATDAHAKNFSLLLRGRDVRLAPLYDVASVLPYDTEPGARTAMKIGKTWELAKTSGSDWSATGRALGLSETDALARVERLRHAIPDAFQTVAVGPSVPPKLHERAATLATLVTALIERRFDAFGRVDPTSPARSPL